MAFPSKISNEIQKIIYPDYQKIKNLVIFEDGKKDIKKSYYLTETLSKDLKINDIRIIEESPQKAQELSKISHNLILTGKIVKPSFWHSQELNETDAFLALSENCEKNILAGLMGSQLGVPVVFAKADLPEYTVLSSSTPLTSILSPSILSINQILQKAHHNEIINMAILNYLELEAIEYEVLENSKIVNKPIKKLSAKKDLIISHVLRKNNLISSSEQSSLKIGDKVLIITSMNNLSFLSDMFRKQK